MGLGFFVACGNAAKEDTTFGNSDTIPVRLLPLQQGQFEGRIETSGLFTSDDETVLSFKNGGIIGKIYVQEGDAVKKGQLLATLNPTEVNAAYGQAKLAAEKAARDYDRAKQLYADSVATLEQLENAETAFLVAREQLGAAQFNSGQTAIRAPGTGYVLRKLANEGQVVGPGTPILQTNSAQQSGWQLKVGLGDREWAAIALGDEAFVTFDALEGDSLAATVHKKSEGIDPSSGTFSVMLKLSDKTDKSIGAGMFAKAVIIPKAQDSVWRIPFDAVLDADGGHAFVFVSNDGKHAKKIPIKLAGIQEDGVLVTKGLEQAKALIVAGSAYLTDGAPIKVIAAPRQKN